MTRWATVSVDLGTNAGRLRFDATTQSGGGAHDTGGRQPNMGNDTKVEFSAIGFCPAFAGADVGRLYEDLGYDIKQFGENHTQSADVFAEMRDAAAATSRIRLLAGPANFVTRDPGVIASGVAAVQVASGGRAICGIARGDSAVMLAGKRPQRHDDLVRDLGFLQTYLGGGALEFGAERSSLEWLGDLPYAPVPVELVCSGPRTIALAAAVADRIGLSVGANPERIRWAMEIIDASLAEHGRYPSRHHRLRLPADCRQLGPRERSQGAGVAYGRMGPHVELSGQRSGLTARDPAAGDDQAACRL